MGKKNKEKRMNSYLFFFFTRILCKTYFFVINVLWFLYRSWNKMIFDAFSRARQKLMNPRSKFYFYFDFIEAMQWNEKKKNRSTL